MHFPWHGILRREERKQEPSGMCLMSKQKVKNIISMTVIGKKIFSTAQNLQEAETERCRTFVFSVHIKNRALFTEREKKTTLSQTQNLLNDEHQTAAKLLLKEGCLVVVSKFSTQTMAASGLT